MHTRAEASPWFSGPVRSLDRFVGVYPVMSAVPGDINSPGLLV